MTEPEFLLDGDSLPQSLKDEIDRHVEQGFDPTSALALPESCLPKVKELVVFSDVDGMESNSSDPETIQARLENVLRSLSQGESITFDFRDVSWLQAAEGALRNLKRFIEEKEIRVLITPRTRDAAYDAMRRGA